MARMDNKGNTKRGMVELLILPMPVFAKSKRPSLFYTR